MGNYLTEGGMAPPPAPTKYPTYTPPASTAPPAAQGVPNQWVNPDFAVTDPRGTMAGIIRNQWTDFQNTTVPIIKGLEGMTTYNGNKGIGGGLQTDARNNAKAAFGNIVTDAQRTAQGYGMSLSPAESGTLSRAAKLGMAAATTDGVNRANDFQQDINRQIAAGSSLSTVKGA